MRPAKGLHSGFINLGTKATVSLVVAVLVFSPFNQVLQISIVAAATTCPADTAPNTFGGGCHAVCPKGTTEQSYPGGSNCFDAKGNKVDNVTNSTPVNPDGSTGKVVAASGNGSTPFDSIASFLASPIYVFTVGLGGLVAGVGSLIFNETIQISLSSTAYALDFISQGWGTARDVANMFFILILIYLAINIMLKADTHGTMNTLAWVLFIALIINFSFFFTRVVIDAGNLAAVQFYNAIVTNIDKTNTTLPSQAVTTISGKQDLTAAIMQAVGVQNILGTDSFKNFQDKTNGLTEFIVLVFVYVCMGGAYLILGAAFVATGIKFLMRTLVLWLCIIASPLAFVANTMPETKKWYTRWQDKLISNTFYPVVFLFIFWLITLFSKDLDLSTAFNAYANSNVSGFAGNLVNLVSLIGNITIRLGFVIGMLMLGLKLADDIGVAGAKMANNAGNRLSFGGAGLIGRNTAGRAGLALTRNEGLRDWASRSAVGSTLLRGAGMLSRRSFDARALPGAGQLKDQLGAAGGKGGIAKSVSDKEKNRQKTVDQFAKDVKGDIVDERNAQAAYKARYDRENGGRGSYDARVSELTTRLSAQNREAANKRAEAARTSDQARANDLREDAKDAERNIKGIQADLKYLQERGKSTVSSAGKRRTGEIAKRLSTPRIFGMWQPSRATLKAADHIAHEKSEKDKLAEAATKVLKEEQEAEAAPAPAVARPAAAAATATPATPPVTPPAGGGGNHPTI